MREEDDMRAMDAATEMGISCPDSHGSDIRIQHDKGVLSNMPDKSLLDTKAHERRWQRSNVKESRTPQTERMIPRESMSRDIDTMKG